MTLLLFDVDGTLVDSGKKIDPYMVTTLNALKNKYEIGIVGGGSLERILEQMNNKVIFDHYFTECGCVYYKNSADGINKMLLHEIYAKDIRRHPLYDKINLLVKKSLLFLSNVDYTITGNFIDLRRGIIYISLIGMSATEEERKYFLNYDAIYNIRESLLTILTTYANNMEINDDISIVEGGSVGIAIYPSECDKIQILPHLHDYKDIHYFGDKYETNGNDYQLLHHPDVKGHKVDSKIDTLNILKQLYS
tara:strand:+ start:697 stop:1446 length:750 start_codon:yes stop_codon:yes gene_type:complete